MEETADEEELYLKQRSEILIDLIELSQKTTNKNTHKNIT